jgi:mono/diheme cytochrome c family protein
MKSPLSLVLALLAPSIALAAGNAEELFVRRIGPLFHEKCLACHGQDDAKIKGGLDMRSLAAVLKGGDSELPALVVGKPEESPLYLAATRTHDDWEAMPPKEADKLYAEQLGWMKEWIAGGAPWPDEARQKEIAKANEAAWSAEDGVVVKTVGALSPEWANRKYKPEGLWAYQPVRKPDLEKGRQQDKERNPIDALIGKKMPAGLAPAPVADRVTLIRRATFDLLGLPPRPEEVEAFVKDARPDAEAFAAVVERLLDSPHYGERMAQHWLDVTRYADSSGFANDFERGNAWRYRDYVVRSFNADKPYDRFVREQIAGDEIEPGSPEMLVATGFLRMGPWELTAMEVAKVARQRFLDDVSNSVGETFLAHSLQCARCHDHKFDPIPTHDYYSLQAVFATTQIAERPAPFLKEENTQGFEEKKLLELSRADHLATLKRLEEKALAAVPAWFAEKKLDSAKWDAALQEAKQKGPGKRGGLFTAARNLLLKQGVPEDQFPPRMLGWTPEEIGMERIASKGLERLQWELDRYQPVALAIYNGRTPQVTSIVSPFRMPQNRMNAGELEETCILTGGDPFGAGAKVKPGVLSVLGSVQKTPIPQTIEGRRKAFADWVASAENPLTTRAIVNRIWLWHFDQPIAGNPNNFGSTGKRPTHPELLDWLAATFVENGWSFKAMHRLIMNSETYRRSTRHPDAKTLAEKDPAGTSYAVFKPRRLTAEELRDAMLTATGELNPTLGGIPNRPEINLEAALQPRQVMGTFAAAWTPNPLPQQRHRRSLYALKIRGLPDPLQEVFNAPTPDFSCERREASTVTPQVFSLFNSQTTHARALALANRAVKESKSDEQAIARVFALAFSRPPSADERQSCLAHWREIEALIGDETPPAQKPPLEVRRDAIEENTGEKFSFNEKLHAYAEFVPDLQPAAVPAHTRALADVCLALLNSNESAYVY